MNKAKETWYTGKGSLRCPALHNSNKETNVEVAQRNVWNKSIPITYAPRFICAIFISGNRDYVVGIK